MHTFDTTELELVLGLNPRRSARKSFREVIAEVSAALKKAQVEYVIGGAIALGVYLPHPRATADVDLIALERDRTKVKSAFAAISYLLLQDLPYQLSYRDPVSRIEVDILLGATDPELSAAEDPQAGRVLGAPTLVIKPEYLLWMYCLSDQPRHFADAVALVQAKKVDVALLRRYLTHAQDKTAQAQLMRVMLAAARTRHSTYSDRVAARLRDLPTKAD